MRISHNWLKDYLPVDLPVADIATILTSLGLEVSGVEHVESIKGGLRGVVAGKVIACEKHPNADRLFLTKVDIGSGTLLQIVCGAPNVAKGQTVWVATVGSTLYPTGKTTPLTIAKAKVRGEFSEGMICAEDELGFGTDHSGILILPDEVAIGTSAADYYQVTKDDVIDIELTPNRSDAICVLGVARDLAAWYSVNRSSIALCLPEIPEHNSKTADYPITVEVNNPEACPRYCGVTISGIRVGESPKWLQDRLGVIGVRAINNIVDITNFVLHEMGQPLHAFDADKIKNHKVIVKTLPAGTPFVTLDQVQRTLAADDLMICDGESNGMCIAGVYGGIGTGISENTTTVFLESAHFHPRWIRRTSMRHDLRTEAARTFEKTTDPNICRDALLRAADFIVKITGGQIASEVVDIYPVPVKEVQVPVRWKMIRRLTGIELSQAQVLRIFEALQMSVVSQDNDAITVSIPTNKADVTREADVIEEILRIYGFDHVQMKAKMEIALTIASRKTLSTLRDELGNFLAAQGFLESMGMSLVESRQYEQGPLQITQDARILIDNTSNVHLDMMRHHMLTTALETIRFNQNRMQSDLMLCEFGRTYRLKEGHIHEEEGMTLSMSGSPLKSGWRNKNAGVDFYFLKKYVHLTLEHLGIVPEQIVENNEPLWEYALEYRSDHKPIVTYGKISRAVMQQYDVKNPLFFADFSMGALLNLSSEGKLEITEIAKFPAVRRDIAIVLSNRISFAQVEKTIIQAGGHLLTDCNLFDIYENVEALGGDKRSLAVSLVFQDATRTLIDTDVNIAVENIVSALKKETGAVLR